MAKICPGIWLGIFSGRSLNQPDLGFYQMKWLYIYTYIHTIYIHTCMHACMHTYLHYIPFHCIALHCITHTYIDAYDLHMFGLTLQHTHDSPGYNPAVHPTPSLARSRSDAWFCFPIRGVCWRKNTEIPKKKMPRWVFIITRNAIRRTLPTSESRALDQLSVVFLKAKSSSCATIIPPSC